VFHGRLALSGLPIFGLFALNGQKIGQAGSLRPSSATLSLGSARTGRGAIAPNMAPMLDSEAMCASVRKVFDTSRSLPLPGSLALLLRR
jgi:hypothetical protein